MKRNVITLFCVGAASASAGPLVSALLAAAVAPAQGTGSEATAKVPVPAVPSPIDGIRLAKLLRLEQQSSPPPEPQRRYRLRGTLAPMFAAIEPIEGGRVRSFALGDALDDATIEEIGHGFVLLRRGDATARLMISSTAGLAPGGQRIEISRKELEDARARIIEIASQVRVVPAFEGGAAIGVRVAWMAPGALARKAGLEQGDVVTAVNGHRLDNLQDTAALLKEASAATQFSADVIRAGASLRLEVKAL